MERVRLTLTHDDFNVLLSALSGEREEIMDFAGRQDPYLLKIERVADKLQAARSRMERTRV